MLVSPLLSLIYVKLIAQHLLVNSGMLQLKRANVAGLGRLTGLLRANRLEVTNSFASHASTSTCWARRLGMLRTSTVWAFRQNGSGRLTGFAGGRGGFGWWLVRNDELLPLIGVLAGYIGLGSCRDVGGSVCSCLLSTTSRHSDFQLRGYIVFVFYREKQNLSFFVAFTKDLPLLVILIVFVWD